ncbi:hypothetical protein LINGRAHAP2_LOCUS24871 [Linum grandiflorum]
MCAYGCCDETHFHNRDGPRTKTEFPLLHPTYNDGVRDDSGDHVGVMTSGLEADIGLHGNPFRDTIHHPIYSQCHC